ncbi:MAG: hypothetical protein ABR991_05015, partial [Terracidiphilus sp.]
FAGSTLLRRHYHEVPLLSLVWGVGQIGLPFNESGAISILGLSLPLEADSTIVASVSPTLESSLRLRVEEETSSEADAARQAAALATLVTLARDFTLPLAGNAENSDLKELLKTAEVTQKHDRVLVTATVDHSLFSNLAANAKSPADTSAVPAASK